MSKVIFTLIGCMMLVSILADPAPVSIQFEDVILLSLPLLLALFTVPLTVNYQVSIMERQMLLAVMFYLSYLLVSFFIGLLQGVSLLSCLRAVGPYINFFPLLILGFIPRHRFNPWTLALILIAVGSLQAIYQMLLYLKHAHDISNTMDVLRGRITLIDPRTTLPLILCTAILPFGLLSMTARGEKKNIIFKLICVSLMILSLFGAIATLTRAIILSLFFGWTIVIMLFVYGQVRHHQIIISHKSQLIWFGAIIVVLLFVLSELPTIKLLEQSVVTRFHHAAEFSASGDYSNGRLYDEWMPALDTWMHSGIVGLFFGIGAGNSFNVITGEERTYIHNLLIYSLVYGGLIGFFACIMLYFTAFKILLYRAWQTKKMIYLSFAALLGTLFFYSQLFAVHKGLAYNALLFLIIAVAL